MIQDIHTVHRYLGNKLHCTAIINYSGGDINKLNFEYWFTQEELEI